MLQSMIAHTGLKGWLRDELLNETCLTRCPTPSFNLAVWSDNYDTVRQHNGLGKLPPATYDKICALGMQWDGADLAPPG